MSPSRLNAKRMVYSIPRRATSLAGGTQQARSAAYISPIEVSGFGCTAAPELSPLLPDALSELSEWLSSVEMMVRRKSSPIGGRYWGS